MLALKKAELERSLPRKRRACATSNSRLTQIDEQGALSDYDVVVKSAAGDSLSSRSARVYPTLR